MKASVRAYRQQRVEPAPGSFPEPTSTPAVAGALGAEQNPHSSSGSKNRAPRRVARSVAGARVKRRLAKALLGQEVSLATNSGQTVHGIVTSVLAEGSEPRVVVGGFGYDLAQILTVAPPELGCVRTEA